MLHILSITVRADIGGGPEHLFQLLTRTPTDIRQFVACPDDAPYFKKYVDMLGEESVYKIPHRKFSVMYMIGLLFFCTRNKIDIIHSHGKGAGIYSRLVGTILRLKVVHTFHGLHIKDYSTLMRYIYLNIEKFLGKRTTVGISVSDGERLLLNEVKLLSREKLITINNGVVIPGNPSSKRNNLKFNILAVNRFNHQKNPDMIINIAAYLVKAIGSDKFVIQVFGEGEDFSRIRKLLKKMNLENSVLLNGLTYDIREQYRLADLFISTSRWEGMPLAVLEAMSEGTPVVVSNVVGNRDVVESNISGFLFDVNSPTDASEKILKLYFDEQLKVKMGTRAYEYVKKHYSVEQMSDQTYQVYKNLHTNVSDQQTS